MKHLFAFIRIAPVASLLGIGCVAVGQPAEVVGSLRLSISEMTAPSQIMGLFDDSGFPLQARFGKANSSPRASGFSLASFELPFQIERVWVFDLTDPMPLVFTRKGWVRGDQTPRTVRMYYHVGFNAQGKAVAAAQWFTGPTAETKSQRSGLQGQKVEPTTFWNYCFPAMLERYGQPDKIGTTFWTPKDGDAQGLPARPHRCPRDKTCERCGHVPPDRRTAGEQGNPIGTLLAAREPNGAYTSRGWVMGTGSRTRASNWAVVGEAWGMVVSKPGENGNPPPFWILEQPGRSDPNRWLVCDLRLVLEWAPDLKVSPARILRAASSQARPRTGIE